MFGKLRKKTQEPDNILAYHVWKAAKKNTGTG